MVPCLGSGEVCSLGHSLVYGIYIYIMSSSAVLETKAHASALRGRCRTL